MKTRIEMMMGTDASWIWALFFGGSGFALGAIAIVTYFLVSRLRLLGREGKLKPSLAEFFVILLFVPSMSAVAAIALAIGSVGLDVLPESFWLFPIAAIAVMAGAWSVWPRSK